MTIEQTQSQQTVVIRDGGVVIGDHPAVPLLSGEFHYWRNHPDDWPRIMEAMAEAGLTFVTSFVQFNVHEYEPGKFDFTGATSPLRNIPEWMQEAQRVGLLVQLRPGPACCEWRNSGGSSFGTHWHDGFRAFWEAVSPFQATLGGPLALLQVHNEWIDVMGMFDVARGQIGNFDGFHTPPMPFWMERCQTNFHYIQAGYDWRLDLFSRYLKQIYPSVEELNQAWGTEYESFEHIQAESRYHGTGTLYDFWQWAFEPYRGQRFPDCNLLRLRDLIWFLRLYKGLHLREETDFARECGCQIPITHNWPMGPEREYNQLAGIQLSGYDLYRTTDVNVWEWLVMMYDMQENELPYSGEFMTGTIDRYVWWGQGVNDETFHRFGTLAYFGNGLKAINHYMFVERDNWLQCPIDTRGGLRPAYQCLASIHQALRQAALHQRRRLADLLVVRLSEYTLAHQLRDPSTANQPNVEAFTYRGISEDYIAHCVYGDRDPKTDFFNLTVDLHETAIDFEVASSIPEEAGKFRAVYLYVLEGLDRQSLRSLEHLCNLGMTVVIGPQIPTHTWDGRPMTFLEDLFDLHAGPRRQASGIQVPDHTEVLKPIGKPSIEIQSLSSGAKATTHIQTVEGDTVGVVFPHGKGKLVALGCLPHEFEGLTSYLWQTIAGCQVYAKTTGTKQSDAHVFKHPTQKPAVIVYNGDHEASVTALELSETVISHDAENLLNMLNGEVILPALRDESGTVVYDIKIPPRDAALFRFTAGTHHASPAPREEFVLNDGWTLWHEDWQAYLEQWTAPDWTDGWIRVPKEEWTLPAIASGKVFGVQGWFWIKATIPVPAGEGPLYLRLRSDGYDHFVQVYVNGHTLGSIEVERPGGSTTFDLSSLKHLGTEITVAVRVYRQTLDCNDLCRQGFTTFQLQRDKNVSSVSQVWLRQDGWVARAPSDKPSGKRAIKQQQLPIEQKMCYGQHILWLHQQVQLPHGMDAYLRCEGVNGKAEVFVDGQYITSTPYLPVTLPLGKLGRGKRELVIRWTGDREEWYTIHGYNRYKSWIEDMHIPIPSRIDSVVLFGE